jgi:hypothetical protein
MRLRKLLIYTAMISLGLSNANAASPLEMDRDLTCLEPLTSVSRSAAVTKTADPMPLPPAPSPVIEKDKVLSDAYYHALAILSDDNTCSAFFGGATGAVTVFNTFMRQVRKAFLQPTIGMRMSGEVTMGVNAPTQTKFRLFENVSINTNGPFYRKKFSLSDQSVPRLGRFEPNTKEIRVLILLHELAHLIKGDDGKWLLPDDGRGESISRSNSEKIEEVCRDQLTNLSRSKSE